MGDHHDGLAELVDRPAEEPEHLGRRLAVEVAGGLVSEDQLGSAGEGPGDGDALLLAARQLGRTMPEPVAETDGVDDGVEPAWVQVAASEVGGEGDVLGRREGRDQVEGLEHEPHVVAAQDRELLVGHARQSLSPELDVAGGEGVEARQAVHERRLARPGRSHDHGERTAGDVDVHTVEGPNGHVTHAVGLHCRDRTSREPCRHRFRAANECRLR